MQFTNVIETHITEVGCKCCEVLDALKKKFPDRQVDYLVGGQHQTTIGYKLSGSITKQETKAIMRLIAKTLLDRNDKATLDKLAAEKFMKTWKPKELPAAEGSVVLIGLRETIFGLHKYVESHKKDAPEIAKSMAMDSDDLTDVYKLWHSGNRIMAAQDLRNLDTIVRDYVDRKTYQAIMEHLK